MKKIRVLRSFRVNGLFVILSLSFISNVIYSDSSCSYKNFGDQCFLADHFCHPNSSYSNYMTSCGDDGSKCACLYFNPAYLGFASER